MRQQARTFLAFLACFVCAIAAAATPDWIARSNSIAQPILESRAKLNPEQASFRGLDAFDTSIGDVGPGAYERKVAQLEGALAALRRTRESESDTRVEQDIEIMIGALENDLAVERAEHAHLFEYSDAMDVANGGLSALLDPRNKPDRQARALVRLKRYAGREPGYTPLATLARQRIERSMANRGLAGPYVEQVKQNVKNTDILLAGVADLFRRAKLTGWEEDFAALSAQMREFRDWQERAVLPRARTEVMLPRDVYAALVRQRGVDMAPEEIMERATAEWQEVTGEIQQLAADVAKARGLPSARPKDVIAALKKEQLAPDAMLSLYRERLKAIEAILQREKIITLPAREMAIRAATPAEAAQTPAPQMRPPRLIGNTGEYGEFVIPLVNPHAKSGAAMDDFTFDAATWTVAAHEARPGHELQFASMVEQGVSLARSTFALNSANSEGWGLYCETLVIPYIPVEARLIGAQYRLARIARATLDPMLNLGRITPQRAKEVLMEDVGMSEPFSQQEVDRYTFWAPGQATSYFYGLQKLRSLRTQVEIALGPRFDQRAFHDFIIAQGMLPPPIMARAVMEQFVPAQQSR